MEIKFSQWVLSESKEDALKIAEENWNSKILSKPLFSYGEAREIISNRTPGAPDTLEHFVIATVLSTIEDEQEMIREAAMMGWDRR